ncbi:putative zinc protease AlbF [Oxobacter pfennigii]|uniref:Putative zinc protease AlbF n=1 Tax=Oxobacter pfennigii TaxID=36849 RepID=A0A0P8YAM2_9CLOT|nr:pitrilysin family protein [Oxobacter pfennigii]KPU44047.1 putative zinc protease AlbF [Oxobacter pfennigii]
MNIINNESIDEKLYYEKQSAGLDIYVIPKKGYSLYYGIMAVNYGSNDNEFLIPGSDKSLKVPDGIAHFLEHKMFDKKEGNLLQDYGALGSTPNAYTNATTTAYLFTTTADIKKNVELLFRNVHEPYFTDESIDREKEIIGQEIKMYQDNPSWKVYFNLLDCMYIKHPVKKEIAGSYYSISEISKELLYECYDTFYRPSNLVFLLVGDVEPEEIIGFADENIKRYEKGKKEKPLRIYPHEPAKLNKKHAEEKMEISRPLFAMGFKDIDIGFTGDLLLQKEIETEILLEGMFGKSSPIFKELYDKGLINNSFGSDFMSEKDYGYSIVSGESKEPETVSKIIEDYIKRDGINILSKKRFETIKKKLIGHFLASFNSNEFIGSNFISYKMKGINLFDYMDTVERIEYNDIENRFLNHITEDVKAMSIIYPN